MKNVRDYEVELWAIAGYLVIDVAAVIYLGRCFGWWLCGG